jgi:O-antigen biosynthesis protein
MNIPILLFHSVSDQASSIYRPWAITPKDFESHIAYLCDQGYQPLTIGQVAQIIRAGGVGLPGRPVVLTFDDGMADFLSGAVPILNKYQFPATLYIVTGNIGQSSKWLTDEGEQNRPMLSWDEITCLSGIEIGAHSHTHPQLDIVSLSKAREEILISKEILEQHLSSPVQTFAFPHGYHTSQLVNLVQDAGYTSACIVGHEMATDSSNVFSLPRIIVTSDVTTTKLGQYLQGIDLRQDNAWRKVLQITWRMVRKIKATTSKKLH